MTFALQAQDIEVGTARKRTKRQHAKATGGLQSESGYVRLYIPTMHASVILASSQRSGHMKHGK